MWEQLGMRMEGHQMLQRRFSSLVAGVIALTPLLASAFDVSAYRATSLSEIAVQWNSVTKGYAPGFSAKTPERIAIQVKSTGAPFKCKVESLQLILNTVGMTQALQQAPVSHCIKVRVSDQSNDVIAYVQDALVQAYLKDAPTGSDVKLYALFPAYAVSTSMESNSPVLLVSAFEAP